STTRASVSLKGDLSLGEGTCGERGRAFTALDASVDVLQDSLHTNVSGDLATLDLACRNCVTGHVEWTHAVPAPGWQAVVTSSGTFSGPRELGCRLGA